MDGTSPRVQAWKTQAEYKRQLLANALDKKPGNPWVAAWRDRYIKLAEVFVDNQKAWAEARASHFKELSQILTRRGPVASASASKGSLGDAG